MRRLCILTAICFMVSNLAIAADMDDYVFAPYTPEPKSYLVTIPLSKDSLKSPKRLRKEIERKAPPVCAQFHVRFLRTGRYPIVELECITSGLLPTDSR